MQLIIISGPEATGKSEIGHRIAKQLEFQYESKDNIKEALFDKKPRSTWDYSWYENQAKQQFFQDIKQLVLSNKDSIIESNFAGNDKLALQKYLNDEVNLVEIYCTARGMTSFRRFVSPQ